MSKSKIADIINLLKNDQKVNQDLGYYLMSGITGTKQLKKSENIFFVEYVPKEILCDYLEFLYQKRGLTVVLKFLKRVSRYANDVAFTYFEFVKGFHYFSSESEAIEWVTDARKEQSENQVRFLYAPTMTSVEVNTSKGNCIRITVTQYEGIAIEIKKLTPRTPYY